MKDPNKGSVGNVQARDHVINTFLKNKPEGAAEISVNHTDSDGNTVQQKVGIDGSISDAKITQRSEKGLYKTANRIYDKTCSKSKVGFSGISKDRWDLAFGNKDK